MSAAAPKFWSQPIRFLRYVSHTKPHLVLAVGFGAAAPVLAIVGIPLRKKYLYPDAPEIPLSYPSKYTERREGTRENERER